MLRQVCCLHANILKLYDVFYQFTCDSRWRLWLKMKNNKYYAFLCHNHYSPSFSSAIVVKAQETGSFSVCEYEWMNSQYWWAMMRFIVFYKFLPESLRLTMINVMLYLFHNDSSSSFSSTIVVKHTRLVPVRILLVNMN